MAGEYKGDFTRDTNYAFKHFSRVLMQQGRVQLDADWNEQAAILLDLLRGLGADTIGPFARVDDGFVLQKLQVSTGSANVRDFVITPGDCYVDGVLCRVEGTPIPFADPSNLTSGSVQQVTVSEWLVDGVPFQEGQYVEVVVGASATKKNQYQITKADPNTRTLTLNPPGINLTGDSATFRMRRLTTFRTQPDYPLPQDLDLLTPDSSKNYLVYLDVWERHITYVEDGSIREIALGGPDTATRAQVVSQVKIAFDSATANFSGTKDPAVLQRMLADQFQPYNRGWLRARTKPAPDPHSTDPCITHPDARYRGAENQLYRVEIHIAGAVGTATFKWSRENASVIFPILSLTGSEVFLETLGRDSRFGLKVDDWVEILDDHFLLQGRPGPLFQVSEVSVPDRRVVLKGSSGPPTIKSDDPDYPHAFLRRWDHKDTSGNGIAISEITAGAPDSWIDLEDGIQIQFQPALSPVVKLPGEGLAAPPPNQYRTGDYWLIPARTAANGVIDWPVTKDDAMKTVPIALPPHGIDHHYAPLGLIPSSGPITDTNITLFVNTKKLP